MSISTVEISAPKAQTVNITSDTLTVELMDGRTISVPLTWYPRLLHSSEEERKKWRLIGKGNGIHWDDLDEDISIIGLLAGKPSQESHSSFKKWFDNRNKKAASQYSRYPKLV